MAVRFETNDKSFQCTLLNYTGHDDIHFYVETLPRDFETDRFNLGQENRGPYSVRGFTAIGNHSITIVNLGTSYGHEIQNVAFRNGLKATLFDKEGNRQEGTIFPLPSKQTP